MMLKKFLLFLPLINANIVAYDTAERLDWYVNITEFPDHIQAQLEDKRTVRGFSRDPNPRPSEQKIQVRKFVQMKQLINFMLGAKAMGSYDKFCGYGCWCFPDGSTDIMVGKGPALDPIDRTCFHLRQCYKCLEKDGCDYKDTSYSFKAVIDEITGDRNIICDSNQNACRRNLCECDREMARGIVQESLQWKQQLHDRYGFDRERMCSGAGHSNQSAKTQWKFNGTKDKQPEQCCGSYPKRHPFDSNKSQCCDNRLVGIGSC